MSYLMPGILLSIGEQLLHFLLCTSIAWLEVVEYGVIPLGNPLIGILSGGHVRDLYIRILRGFFSISTDGLDQAGRTARDCPYALVSRQDRRFLCYR